jgi:uncharacterized membrane protein (UPF0127 family)
MSGGSRVSGILMLLALAGCVCSRPLPETAIPVNDTLLDLEIAADHTARACGLAYRESLPADRGMLFVMAEPTEFVLWMRDTKMPLSIAFLDEQGRILNIQDAQPAQRRERYSSPADTRYAIEVNRGWFERHQVEVGDTLEIDLPASLRVR